jgi:predicted nuclease with TOPRIM domain
MSASPSLFSDIRAELAERGYILKRFGYMIVEYNGLRVGLYIQRGSTTYIKEVANMRDLLDMVRFMLRCLAERLDAEAANAEKEQENLMKELDEAKAELERVDEPYKEAVKNRVARLAEKVEKASSVIMRARKFVSSVEVFLGDIEEVRL